MHTTGCLELTCLFPVYLLESTLLHAEIDSRGHLQHGVQRRQQQAAPAGVLHDAVHGGHGQVEGQLGKGPAQKLPARAAGTPEQHGQRMVSYMWRRLQQRPFLKDAEVRPVRQDR